MVFRYLGDRHADVQQFRPLVDARAGGIADTALIEAIRSRGWHAERLDGSINMIRAHIDAGQPLILLIEDRPSRYHYVVAVGADEEQVWVHDPTWGPARRLAASELLRRWKPTGFWTLLVTRGDESTKGARDALKGVPYQRESGHESTTDARDAPHTSDSRGRPSGLP